MLLSAKRAWNIKISNQAQKDSIALDILEKVKAQCTSAGKLSYEGDIPANTVSLLTSLGYEVNRVSSTSWSISWNVSDPNDVRFVQTMSRFDSCADQHTSIQRGVKIILALCIVIIILLLSLTVVGVVIWQTKQVGLVAIIDTPPNSPDIPGYDPDAIVPPDDDKVQKLNEKLDKGKMAINMVSKVTFDTPYTTGYVNIVNDEANNYPQFVTITLDSNGAQIYQSGLIEVGKSVPYAMLEIELSPGDYDCTAVFSQVDTDTNTICGQAAAKVKVTVKG